MINTRIAYTQEDGSVAIVMPTPEFCACPDSDVYKLARKSMPLGTHFEVLDVADIPTDRYFRNAWRLGAPLSKSIDIDEKRAREIHVANLRITRGEKLKEQDIEYQKALELNDTVKMQSIASKKQKLRDMPGEVDFSGLSLQELKDYTPSILK
jgi:hypothetical protein